MIKLPPPPLPHKTIRQFALSYLSAKGRNHAAQERIENKIERANMRMEAWRRQQRIAFNRRRATISKLCNEKARISVAAPSWINKILSPLAEEMLKHLPPGYEISISGPFGLPSNTFIWFTKKGVPASEQYKGENTMFVGFRPLALDSADRMLGLIDCATNTGEYKPGSIGAMNDLNHPTCPLPSDATAMDLIIWMHDQHAKLK